MSVERATEVTSPEEFSSMTNKQLVEWFAANCGDAPCPKKFNTVSIGVERCALLFGQIQAQKELEKETEELSDEEFQAKMLAELDANFEEEKKAEQEAQSKKVATRAAIDAILEAEMPQDSIIHDPVVRRALRSKNVSDSWSDPEVRKRRNSRNKVEVSCDGEKKIFRSVREAFWQLGLPMWKNVKFRINLKKSGEELFEHEENLYAFRVIWKE